MFLYCSTVTFFWCHTSPQTAHLSSRFRPRGRLSQLLQPPCVAHRDTGIGSHGNVGTDPRSQAFTTAAVNHFKTSEKWACMNLHQNWKLYEMSNSEMGTWIRQQGCLYPVLQLANISLQLNLLKSTWHPKLLPFAWLVLQFCSFLSFSTFETCVHGLLYVAHWPMVLLIEISVYRGKIAGESPKVVVHWSEPTWNNKFKICRGT